ncbi:MAG: peptidase [Thermodesulfobacteriota bacterium]
MEEAITKLFAVNLVVKAWGGEKVLVFTDLVRDDEEIGKDEKKRREGARRVARTIAEVAKRLCNTHYIEYPSLGSHGTEPPARVWEAAFGPRVLRTLRENGLLEKLLEKKVGAEEIKKCEEIVRERTFDPVTCVIALSNYSTSHTRFRDFITRIAGARYASMPLFEESMLDGAMAADWDALRERTIGLALRLGGADAVHMETPNGTSISMSIKGREVLSDTGILSEAGSFGNLPAGEAYVAPVEGSANGKLVLEWAPTKKLKSPITLEVRDGTVVGVSGDDAFARELEWKIKENPLFGNIAELGIGTNDMATRADNILESEKILGTVHIAIGDNSSFGGMVRVPFHQDFVFFKPTLSVERGGTTVRILKDGDIV